jgi:HEXXH motif-containing protein
MSEAFDWEGWLWRSAEPYDNRLQRSASALAALHAGLEEPRLDAARLERFRRLYHFVAAQDPAHFTAVWTWPTTHVWIRQAFETATGADSTLSGDLGEFIDAFALVAVSVALQAGVDLELERPEAVDLPWQPYAADWYLDGKGRVEIAGVRGGALALADGRLIARGDAGTRLAPVAEVAGASVQVNPVPACHPATDFDEALTCLKAGYDFHAERRELIAETLGLIAAYEPASFEIFREVIRVIGLKPADGEGFRSTSTSFLPGVLLTDAVPDPHRLADTLIHEAHHNRLFFIEDGAPVLDPGAEPVSVYSPWRFDPRPPRGLLHAIYVHIPVQRYWLTLMERETLAEPLAGYALASVLRIQGQLEMGLDILRARASLTEFGRGAIAQMAADIADLRARMVALGLPDDAPAFDIFEAMKFVPDVNPETGREMSVREALDWHREKFDRNGDAIAA